jgi:hypothetical protein
MSIDRTAYNLLIDDSGSGLDGTLWTKNQVKTVILDPIDALIADWSDVAFNAAHYTAATGLWTLTAPDMVTFAYQKTNKTLSVALVLVTTTVSAPTASLRVLIPGGFTGSKRMDAMGYAVDNGGTPIATTNFVAAGGTVINVARLDGANWAASTNLTNVVVTMAFGVN